MNQTDVNSLSFNIEERLQTETNCLNWAYLPINVQNFLLNQKPNLIHLTYLQLGWVDYTSQFAGTELYSLVSKRGLVILPLMSDYVSDLNFDLRIDIDFLKKILKNELHPFHHQIRPYHHLLKSYDQTDKTEYESYFCIINMFFNNFFGYFQSLFNEAIGADEFSSRFETKDAIFSLSIKRIENFLTKKNILS